MRQLQTIIVAVLIVSSLQLLIQNSYLFFTPLKGNSLLAGEAFLETQHTVPGIWGKREIAQIPLMFWQIPFQCEIL